MVTALLAHGADPGRADAHGKTPLLTASAQVKKKLGGWGAFS